METDGKVWDEETKEWIDKLLAEPAGEGADFVDSHNGAGDEGPYRTPVRPLDGSDLPPVKHRPPMSDRKKGLLLWLTVIVSAYGVAFVGDRGLIDARSAVAMLTIVLWLLLCVFGLIVGGLLIFDRS